MRGSPFPHSAASAPAVQLRLRPWHAKALRREGACGFRTQRRGWTGFPLSNRESGIPSSHGCSWVAMRCARARSAGKGVARLYPATMLMLWRKHLPVWNIQAKIRIGARRRSCPAPGAFLLCMAMPPVFPAYRSTHAKATDGLQGKPERHTALVNKANPRHNVLWRGFSVLKAMASAQAACRVHPCAWVLSPHLAATEGCYALQPTPG